MMYAMLEIKAGSSYIAHAIRIFINDRYGSYDDAKWYSLINEPFS